jgi:hypothetical protein
MSEYPDLKPCPNCDAPLYYSVDFEIWCLSCGYIEQPKGQEAQNVPAPETTTISASITLTLTDTSPNVANYIKHHLNGGTVVIEDNGKLQTLNSSFVAWFLWRIDPMVGSEDNELYEAWVSKDWNLTAMIMLEK